VGREGEDRGGERVSRSYGTLRKAWDLGLLASLGQGKAGNQASG
jgi:hypothetical protein